MEEELKVKLQEHIDEISKEILKSSKQRIREEENIKSSHEEQWMESIDARGNNPTPYNKKVLLVVTTPKSEKEYRNSEEFTAIEKLMYDQTFVDEGVIELHLDLRIISNNTSGLSEVYNRFINTDYEDYYVCFIHDDIIIQDTLFFEKIQKYHETFEVLGVAGATKMMLPFSEKRPTAWNILCKDEKGVSHAAGQVTHQHEGKHWASHYGMTPEYGKLLDGILMSFDVSKCLEYGFKFDERFTFHHYDMAASIRALECGFNIGIVPISVLHKSIGQIGEEWKQSHRKFVNAYREYGR